MLDEIQEMNRGDQDSFEFGVMIAIVIMIVAIIGTLARDDFGCRKRVLVECSAKHYNEVECSALKEMKCNLKQ